MTTINASKSEILSKLLRTLVISLSQLGQTDVDLNTLIGEINLFRGNLDHLEVEKLSDALDKAGFLAHGYYMEDKKGPAQAIPETISILKEELDNLVTQERLMGKTSAELLHFSSYFEKLAK
jgi:hypothetical protein